MRRLYLRIYLAVLASLAAFALLASLAWHVWQRDEARPGFPALAAQVAAELLPAQAGPEVLAEALRRWQARTGADLTLRDAGGQVIAAAGAPLPAPPDANPVGSTGRARPALAKRWQRFWRGPAPVSVVTLPDGRTLQLSRPRRGRPGAARLPGFVAMLTLIALAVGVGAYPVVRRLTRRIESLQRTVEAVGAGDLSARAPVRGRDEVAALAASFNRSAERIEALVRAQRSLLANASHELRSPLARIRMALALLAPEADASMRDEMARSVAELDELVDEILLASRLDAIDPAAARGQWEPVDVAALAAEECARAGVRLDVDQTGKANDADDAGSADDAKHAGDSNDARGADGVDAAGDGGAPAGPGGATPDHGRHTVAGDARLLRRLVRNLLDNALRHGGGRPVEMRVDGVAGAWDAGSIGGSSGSVLLAMLDRGPGVPDDERERIFEPFYRVRGASERAGGVGLGLALVRQIAQHHGGSVRCMPRAGGGSRFEVRLPVAADGAARR